MPYEVPAENLLDQQPDVAVGISLPLTTEGNFGATYTTAKQAHSNLINLLMTIKGERPMQPNFGTDLHKLLFEPNTEELRPRLEHTIKDAVKNWLPYIRITSIDITSKINLYQVFVKITYIVNPSQAEDTVEFGANLATGGMAPAY
tara:strand:+ start:865 stop:1302 length:438 start_codon:yes stop_codon:yes gene_type:complete